MTESDQVEFKRILTKLAAVYGAQTNPDMIEGYFVAMKHFSLEAVERACQVAVDECQFFPKPVELRSYASEPDTFNLEERTYACLKCHDSAVIVTERFDKKGRGVGTYAAPCSCAAGEAKRQSWEKPDSHGHTFADSTKANTAKLRRSGAL